MKDAKAMAKFERIPWNDMMNKLVANAVASDIESIYKDSMSW